MSKKIWKSDIYYGNQNRFRHQQLNYISFSAEMQQTIPKWMLITLIPRVLLLSCKCSLHGKIMKESVLSTMSAANKHVPAKSMWGPVGMWNAWFDIQHALEGKYGSQLVWRKPMSALQRKVSSPKVLFIHLHIYHKASVSLSAISLVLIPPRGYGRNVKAQGPFLRYGKEWTALTTHPEWWTMSWHGR